MSSNIVSGNRHNTQKNAGLRKVIAASSTNDRREKNMDCCLSNEPDRGKWIQEATREEITTILENVPCGIYVVEGLLGDTIYINQGCYKISGYDINDVGST